jgi:nicotinamide mononucleotide adenylyltransferase
MRLLELFEQSGKTAAVAFGRMNPPTIGHQKVVEAILKQKADAHFLFVSQTHQPTGKNKTRLCFNILLKTVFRESFPR